MKIDTFGIKNYRSFDEKGVYLSSLRKVNLFIGKNNCGKSNILKFLKTIAQLQEAWGSFPVNEEIQFNKNGQSASLTLRMTHKELGLPSNISDYYQWGIPTYEIPLSNAIKDPIELEFTFRNNSLRIKKEILPRHTSLESELYNEDVVLTQIFRRLNYNADEEYLWAEFERMIEDKLNPEIKNFASRIIYISDFRVINNNDKNEKSTSLINGTNIINELHKMETADIGEEKNLQKFIHLKNVIKDLLNVPDLNLSIPHKRDKIILEINGRRLPLDSFGSGIHELILLCSALIIHDDNIVCLEEPETHLHPELQRKFLNFLLTTNNKYFITTHSNVLLDLNHKEIAIYHVKNNGSESSVSLCSNVRDSIELIEDLGYKASDLLQTNGIIWVEGPSDRVYLNKWIKLVDPSLKEGVDFSIMFYAGKLLSTLSFDINYLEEELIPLLKINRNSFVVIDSDITTKRSQLSITKRRIEAEIGDNCWITKGKEIENYLHIDSINNWLKTKGETKTLKPNDFSVTDILDDQLKKNKIKIEYKSAKHLHSKVICDHIKPEHLKQHSLSKEISRLVKAIHTWNQSQSS